MKITPDSTASGQPPKLLDPRRHPADRGVPVIHAELATTMVSTRQEALALCAAWEAATPGIVARADVLPSR